MSARAIARRVRDDVRRILSRIVGDNRYGCPGDPGPGNRRQVGICHVCLEERSIGYCNICCHWFCRDCSPRVFARTMEAVKELVGGPRPGCCGPKRERQ